VADRLKTRYLTPIGLWLFAMAVYAYVYVTRRTSLPGAEGYEAEGDWQLFFFSITRLPVLLAVLALVLWLLSKARRRP
jgi:hypothetical protein